MKSFDSLRDLPKEEIKHFKKKTLLEMSQENLTNEVNKNLWIQELSGRKIDGLLKHWN